MSAPVVKGAEERYPRLRELGVSLVWEPVPAVSRALVERAVTAKFGAAGWKTFGKLFGVQTCPMVDGEPGFYPWDAEAVIEVMISGKRTGTQAFWD